MNEVDVWARMCEHERTVRRVDASAWHRWAAEGGSVTTRPVPGPPVRRARRLVGRWVSSLGAWIAGAPVEAMGGCRPCTPRSSW